MAQHRSENNWTTPELCHRNYNLAKPWFVWFDFTDPVSGKTVRKQYRNGINLKKTVKSRLLEGNAVVTFLKEKLKSGWNPVTGSDGAPTDVPVSIRAAVDRVIALKRSSLKPKSIRNYMDISRMFLDWAATYGYDVQPLHRFKGNLAQAYLDYLLTERAYSGKSHNGQLGILKAICNVIVSRWKEALPVNPFSNIALLPVNVGRNVAYTEEEARALLAWYRERDITLYYAASFMLHGFIRKTELCELKVSDINWQAGTVTINSDASKNRIQDSVTIPEGLWPVVEEMNLRNAPQNAYIFGHLMEVSTKKISKPDLISYRHLSYVNEIRQGKQNKFTQKFYYEHEEYYNIIRGISEDKTFYSWKHTGVVMYWQAVKDVYYMMRQLRHHDMKTTMVYLKSLGLMPNEAFRTARINI